jgi:hypothetical protein
MSEPRRKTHAKVELVRRAGDDRAPYHASVRPGGPDHVVLYLDVNPENAMSDFIRIEMHYSEARWLAAELALAEILTKSEQGRRLRGWRDERT